MFAGIYGGSFRSDNNVAGYFVMMTSIVAIVNVLAMFFLTSQPPEYSRLTEQEMTNMTDAPSQESSSPEFIDDLNGFKIFKNLDYHLIVWPFVTCAAIELLFIYNVTTFLRSFKMESHDVLLTILGPIVGSISKIQNGFVSDWTMRSIPRASYIILANGMQFLALILLTAIGDHFVVLVIATILVYNANGANMSLVPSIIGKTPFFEFQKTKSSRLQK